MISTHPSGSGVEMTHGEAVRCIRAGEVRILETRHPANSQLPRHAHASASLACVLRGSFVEEAGAATVRCTPLSALFKPAGEEHADHYGADGAECLLIEVPESRLRVMPGTVFTGVLHVASGAVAALVQALATEVRSADALSPVAIEGLVLELLAQIGRQAEPQMHGGPSWLPGVLDMLRSRFREPLIMSDLASDAGIDPSHLARVFRCHEGVTPSEYLRLQRVEWARWRLLRSSDSLASIALDAGFADQSHFTRSFRRVLGVSPGRYRMCLASAPEQIDSIQSPV
jgi:AraC family transcriptional regulator